MSRKKKQISELDLTKVGDRIAYVRLKNNETIKEFAAKTGLSKGNVSGLENHKYEPSYQATVKILELYRVNPTWFWTGTGEAFLNEGERKDHEVGPGLTPLPGPSRELRIPESEREDVFIPPGIEFDPGYFDPVPMAEAHLSGGGGAFVLSERFKEYYAFRKDWLRRIATSPRRAILMPIKGTSMQPTIMDGDIVMLDTGRRRIFDGQIYALGQGETIMVKRLENLVGGRVRVISDNRLEFPPQEVAGKEIRIIGQVIWFARELVPRE